MLEADATNSEESLALRRKSGDLTLDVWLHCLLVCFSLLVLTVGQPLLHASLVGRGASLSAAGARVPGLHPP